MSNNFGLMLSMIFLSLFIVLSGEIISYQQTSAIAMSKTSIIASFIERNGYNEITINNLEVTKYFDRFEMNIDRNVETGIANYCLTTYKQYNAISKVYSFFSGEITCELVICRKEYYV